LDPGAFDKHFFNGLVVVPASTSGYHKHARSLTKCLISPIRKSARTSTPEYQQTSRHFSRLSPLITSLVAC
ncbi:MAG: hypothetical protein R3E94_20185, partial [Burkholderiaceae bacterium]